MNGPSQQPVSVAIACGGTGGHLFPGLAVGGALMERGVDVDLLVSGRDVDREAVRGVRDMRVVTLPAVGLQDGNGPAFVAAAWRSRRVAMDAFRQRPPRAVLAMGGFTAAPPVLAGRSLGARTFLHESNVIPGRANRWLSHLVDACFVGFPEAAERLWHPRVETTGTPVRQGFEAMDPGACRAALGFRPDAPLLLVTGGSQGASGLNERTSAAIPDLLDAVPGLQVLHLTGARDRDTCAAAVAPFGRRVQVRPFLAEMDLALGAATLVVSRSGASSLAEMAAVGVPAILVPFPAATDDHQTHNARAYAGSGAAWIRRQADWTAKRMVADVRALLADPDGLAAMRAAARARHAPDAATDIADRILRAIGMPAVASGDEPGRAPVNGPLLATPTREVA